MHTEKLTEPNYFQIFENNAGFPLPSRPVRTGLQKAVFLPPFYPSVARRWEMGENNARLRIFFSGVRLYNKVLPEELPSLLTKF